MNLKSLVFASVVSVLCVSVAHAAYQSPIGGTAGTSQPVCYSHWQSIGPFAVAHLYPGNNGLDDPEDIGAASSVWVATNTQNPTTAFLAGVNGGVWRSTSFRTYNSLNGPHWTPMTDQVDCLSISSVSGSVTDNTLLVAGCGYTSNAGLRGGEATGVILSSDNGVTWKNTAFPKGYNVQGVLVSGTGATATVLVAARNAVYPNSGTTGQATDAYSVGAGATGGVFRSGDGGATFTKTFTAAPVRTLLAQPNSLSNVFAAAIVPADANGQFVDTIQVSNDGGSTWAATATYPDIKTECPAAGMAIVNTQLSASVNGQSLQIYAGFYLEAQGSSPCYAFFYSNDAGATWTAIANKPNQASGLSLGTQGNTNFAMIAPPATTNILFVSGTGRVVFRVAVDTGVWTLVSSPTIDPISDKPAYQTTASNTAPHSDARQFAWDPISNELLLTNDGGLYKRTKPLGNPEEGDWMSLAGDLAITEFYQIQYDARSGAIVGGAQDNAVYISQLDGTEKTTGIWNYLTTGDGTTVAIDTSVNPSILYGSNQHLAAWFRVPVNGAANGAALTKVDLALGQLTFGTCSPGTASCFPFATMQATNSKAKNKMLIFTTMPKGSNVGYIIDTAAVTVAPTEFDSQALGLGSDSATSYIFGGRKGGVDYPDVILAYGETFVWSRSTACATAACITKFANGVCDSCTNSLNTSPPWKGASTVANYLNYIAQHPQDYTVNILIDDSGHMWLTRNFGVTFIDLNLPANSNLLSLSGHISVDTFNTGTAMFIDILVNGVTPLIVSTTRGIFVSYSAIDSTSFTFKKLGANVPRTVPMSFIYSPSADTLLVALFGRGIYALQSASLVLKDAAAGTDTTVVNSACLTPLYPNVATAFGYNAAGSPAPIGFPAGSNTGGSGSNVGSTAGTTTAGSTAGTPGTSTGPYTPVPSSSSALFQSSTTTLLIMAAICAVQFLAQLHL